MPLQLDVPPGWRLGLVARHQVLCAVAAHVAVIAHRFDYSASVALEPGCPRLLAKDAPTVRPERVHVESITTRILFDRVEVGDPGDVLAHELLKAPTPRVLAALPRKRQVRNDFPGRKPVDPVGHLLCIEPSLQRSIPHRGSLHHHHADSPVVSLFRSRHNSQPSFLVYTPGGQGWVWPRSLARPWPGAIPVVRECFTEHHQGGTLDGGNLAETLEGVQNYFELSFTISRALDIEDFQSSRLLSTALMGRPFFRSSFAKATTEFSVT